MGQKSSTSRLAALVESNNHALLEEKLKQLSSEGGKAGSAASPHIVDAFALALALRRVECAQLLAKALPPTGASTPPLATTAVKRRVPFTARNALPIGVPTLDGAALIHVACGTGRTDMLSLVLPVDLSAFTQTCSLEASGVRKAGLSPAHVLALCESADANGCIELLAQNKYNAWSATDAAGCTALHYACASGYIHLARFLYTQRCDINGKDSAGLTPLHYAADYCGYQLGVFIQREGSVLEQRALARPYQTANKMDAEFFLLCLQWGMDGKIGDKHGRTPAHYFFYRLSYMLGDGFSRGGSDWVQLLSETPIWGILSENGLLDLPDSKSHTPEQVLREALGSRDSKQHRHDGKALLPPPLELPFSRTSMKY